jgi:hypothetical protein
MQPPQVCIDGGSMDFKKKKEGMAKCECPLFRGKKSTKSGFLLTLL